MKLLNEIITVKHGTKKHPWEIDAISGATVSSKAIGKMLNNSAKKQFPRIARVTIWEKQP
jgi:electron transport complex protein RnfG